MPNIVAPTLNNIELSPTEKFFVGDLFVQPSWFEDKYVLLLHLAGRIGDFDYDLLEPEVREDAIDAERRALIEAAQRCPGCSRGTGPK